MPADATDGTSLFGLDTQQTKSHHHVNAPRERQWHDETEKRLSRIGREESRSFPPAHAVETSFRHGGWLPSRRRVAAALASCCVPASRRERFERCGSDCIVEVNEETACVRLRACYCGDRFCSPCSRARAKTVESNLIEWTKDQPVLFVTLTLRQREASLAVVLNHLIGSFAKLRNQKIWTDNVDGGAYVIEVKKGRGGKFWNVHLHVLAIASYIKKQVLSDGWKQASGGSFIVDVRKLSDANGGCRYVAKYATKGWASEVEHVPDDLAECVLALRGRRMLGTFGCWRGRRLERQRSTDDGWNRVGRLVEVATEASRGQHWAIGLMTALHRKVISVGGVLDFAAVDST